MILFKMNNNINKEINNMMSKNKNKVMNKIMKVHQNIIQVRNKIVKLIKDKCRTLVMREIPIMLMNYYVNGQNMNGLLKTKCEYDNLLCISIIFNKY
jgi:hypothetical protein